MEEAALSPAFTEALNFLSLGLSVVLLFAVAYLWSSNSNKAAELERLKTDVQRMKKKLDKVQEKVNQFKEPKVVSDVAQIEPFGLDLSEPLPSAISPLAPQDPWLNFVDDYNKLAAEMSKLRKIRPQQQAEDFDVRRSTDFPTSNRREGQRVLGVQVRGG